MQLPSNYFSFQKVSLRLPRFNLYWGMSPVLFPPVECTCFPASHCFLIIFTFVVSDDLAAFPYSALWSTVLCDICTHSYLVHYHKPGESSCFIPVSVFNLLHPGRQCRPPAIHHLGGPGGGDQVGNSATMPLTTLVPNASHSLPRHHRRCCIQIVLHVTRFCSGAARWLGG